MVFLFFGYHIQNCRSSEKIGRKEIILRFFFLPQGLARKNKTVSEKSLEFIPIRRCVFSPILEMRSNLVRGIFFCKNPEGKKKPEDRPPLRKEGGLM